LTIGAKALKLIIQPKAARSIASIAKYIAEEGYPETSEEFADAMYAFPETLPSFAGKYPECPYTAFGKSGYRCACFGKTMFCFQN